MRFLIAGLAMLVVTSVAAHDETSTHSHDSVEPAADASIVEKRVHRFKQSGAAIQSVFKEHLGNDDFAAIAEAGIIIVLPNARIERHTINNRARIESFGH